MHDSFETQFFETPPPDSPTPPVSPTLTASPDSDTTATGAAIVKDPPTHRRAMITGDRAGEILLESS
jgi:hypothetical protein